MGSKLQKICLREVEDDLRSAWPEETFSRTEASPLQLHVVNEILAQYLYECICNVNVARLGGSNPQQFFRMWCFLKSELKLLDQAARAAVLAEPACFTGHEPQGWEYCRV